MQTRTGHPPTTGRDHQVPYEDCFITPEAHRAAARVLTSGRVKPGPERAAFERDVAHLVGARDAVAVSSSARALELALRSLRLEPGSAVLLPSLAFCGAAGAVVHAGLRPVLGDVDPATGHLSPETVAAALDRSGPVSAMVAVHWAGAPVDVMALAVAAGLPRERVVEDAGHALGARSRGLAVGSGSMVCLSFGAGSNLPVGQGGMVLTDDPDRAEWLRVVRKDGVVAAPRAGARHLHRSSASGTPGLDAEMDDLHAAIGRAQLTHLPRWQHRRRQLARRYDDAFAAEPSLELPHRATGTGSRHAWRMYPLRVPRASGLGREQLVATMTAAGIATGKALQPIHRLPAFGTACAFPSDGLPGAETYAAEAVYLPIHPRLTDEQVDHVCAAVRATAALFGGGRPLAAGQ